MPYPVQVLGTEVLLEFTGERDGTAAPRLADTRPPASELAALWQQLVQALGTLASDGLAHGDMSAYNLLVHRRHLIIIIDMPQVVDVIANPRPGVPGPGRRKRGHLVRGARPSGRPARPRGPGRAAAERRPALPNGE